MPVGSRDLLVLPYFAGELNPICDPNAGGFIAGLTGVSADRFAKWSLCPLVV
jgi:ribulose kinase